MHGRRCPNCGEYLDEQGCCSERTCPTNLKTRLDLQEKSERTVSDRFQVEVPAPRPLRLMRRARRN